MAGKKQTFDPEKHCGRPRAHGYGPCTQPLGKRTDHVGQGACWKHGGCAPIKHGLYTQIQSPTLKAAMERVRNSGADPMDLRPELDLLRGTLECFLEQFETNKTALLNWNATQIGRPVEIITVDAVGVMADRVGRMIERIHKIKMTSSVTYESVIIMVERIGMVIRKHVKDDETLRALLKDIDDVQPPGHDENLVKY